MALLLGLKYSYNDEIKRNLNVNVEEPVCGFLLTEIKYNSALCKNFLFSQSRSILILSCVKKTILDCRVSAAAADKFKIVIFCSIFACNWPNFRVYCSTFLSLQSTKGADFYMECLKLVLSGFNHWAKLKNVDLLI
jgi:hypothetical protein